MKERVIPEETAERIRHRLKADLAETGMKCIPELAGRWQCSEKERLQQ
ncbi:hypothetical protein [Fusibacillus kribbianus]|uniref:Uncharacterized protein n=1 Tax=Fusibacillus kribbianus TaxID=3044208 RepID=A0AAP4BAM1_9FIRM|nr:hypothetical protein [Ruminococcus sp. YH-rum2234]MDI9242744.1 hypothetical protein [Ruminococcus sp. YH-rum2234]